MENLNIGNYFMAMTAQADFLIPPTTSKPLVCEKKIKKKKKNRCQLEGCHKKLGLVPFTCDCQKKFCSEHRLPESHQCDFDHVSKGKKLLAKKNPKVIGAKITQI